MSGVTCVNFVTFSCLREVLNESDATKEWASHCFTLELYIVEGKHLTKAEAIQGWLLRRWKFKECVEYWHDLRPFRCPPIWVDGKQQPLLREVDAVWREGVEARLTAQIAPRLQRFRDAGRARTPSPEGARVAPEDAYEETGQALSLLAD